MYLLDTFFGIFIIDKKGGPMKKLLLISGFSAADFSAGINFEPKIIKITIKTIEPI